MKVNKHLSRYSHYDTHFNRTDPWRHVPWDHEVSKHSHWKEIAAVALGLLAVVVASFVLGVTL